jgi:hypothetical protein
MGIFEHRVGLPNAWGGAYIDAQPRALGGLNPREHLLPRGPCGLVHAFYRTRCHRPYLVALRILYGLTKSLRRFHVALIDDRRTLEPSSAREARTGRCSRRGVTRPRDAWRPRLHDHERQRIFRASPARGGTFAACDGEACGISASVRRPKRRRRDVFCARARLVRTAGLG